MDGGGIHSMVQEHLARKEAQRSAAIQATVEQCDEHWREVVRWGIEEYERQVQDAEEHWRQSNVWGRS